MANLALFLPLGSPDDEDAPNPLVALLMLVLGPLAAGLIEPVISHSCEYAAERRRRGPVRRPARPATALDKIEYTARAMRGSLTVHAPPTPAHLMIANPLAGDGVAALFRTHPPTAPCPRVTAHHGPVANRQRPPGFGWGGDGRRLR